MPGAPGPPSHPDWLLLEHRQGGGTEGSAGRSGENQHWCPGVARLSLVSERAQGRIPKARALVGEPGILCCQRQLNDPLGDLCESLFFALKR